MDTSMAVSEQEFGIALGRLGSVEKTVDRLEHKLDLNTGTTDEILKRIAGLDGGWRVLLAIAGAAGVIGGFIVKLLPAAFHI